MGIWPSAQLSESKKVRLRRRAVVVAGPTHARPMGSRQEGVLWKQKMQSLALRVSKRRGRRHASGAPMKRG